jgi:Protein of unknown function (DUF1638)
MTKKISIAKKDSMVLVACQVMEPELEAAKAGEDNIEIRYLDQGLHRTPKKMATIIQEQIDQAAAYADRIVIGYGLCSNGIVGVIARQQGLYLPNCHDCIAFFMGSHRAYLKAFEAHPGTYYLTPGWVAEKKDPLGIIEDDYTPRLGRETAFWAMEEELKHYTHIALINTGAGNIESLRKRAKENARVLNKQYKEIQGSLDFFKKLLRGPYTTGEFFYLKPGFEVTQEIFLSEAAGCQLD